MPYIFVKDFRAGMDRRRMRLTAPEGSLWTIENAHLSRGAEIDKAKAFVEVYALPTEDSFGLAKLPGGDFTVFGSRSDPGIPSGVAYQQLKHPDDPLGTAIEMVAVESWDLFNGKFYVSARYADGTVHHFYDGVWVDDWYEGLVRNSMTTNDDIAEHIRAFIDANANFTATRNGSVVTVTGPINEDYTVATIVANGEGNSANDQAATATETRAESSTEGKQYEIDFAGTVETDDEYTVTITREGGSVEPDFGRAGRPDPGAKYVKNTTGKMNALGGSIMWHSGVNLPADWHEDTTGAGFKNLANEASGSEELLAMAEYYNSVAIFSRQNIQIWLLDADPDVSSKTQVIQNTGTIASRSVTEFGSNDVIYLDDSGVRSLRSRDSSNAAHIDDIGTPVDDYIQTLIEGAADISHACGVVDPKDGRYMLAIGTDIVVFTHFPSAKISAWSTYSPGFTVTDWAIDGVNKIVYCRGDDDKIYALGGTGGQTYSETDVVTVETPYFDAGDPVREKGWESIDIALEGEWKVEAGFDPNSTEVVHVATISSHTYRMHKIPMPANSTHCFLKMTHSGAGRARVGHLVLRYQKTED